MSTSWYLLQTLEPSSKYLLTKHTKQLSFNQLLNKMFQFGVLLPFPRLLCPVLLSFLSTVIPAQSFTQTALICNPCFEMQIFNKANSKHLSTINVETEEIFVCLKLWRIIIICHIRVDDRNQSEKNAICYTRWNRITMYWDRRLRKVLSVLRKSSQFHRLKCIY